MVSLIPASENLQIAHKWAPLRVRTIISQAAAPDYLPYCEPLACYRFTAPRLQGPNGWKTLDPWERSKDQLWVQGANFSLRVLQGSCFIS